MISKIIQRERNRQGVILNKIKEIDKKFSAGHKEKFSSYPAYVSLRFHKQSLINLKEYMEKELWKWNRVSNWECIKNHPSSKFSIKEECLSLKEDIKELNNIIKRYE